MGEPAARQRLREAREKATAEREAGGAPILLRQRPLADQCDYLAKQLAPHIEPATMPREALIAVGATMVNLGAIGTEIRALQAAYDAATARAEQAEGALAAVERAFRCWHCESEHGPRLCTACVDRVAEKARAAQCAALERAALGFVETEQRFVTHDGRETEFDLHNEDGCGCRREERDLYAGPWRDALERAADEQGVQPVGDAARQGEGGT